MSSLAGRGGCHAYRHANVAHSGERAGENDLRLCVTIHHSNPMKKMLVLMLPFLTLDFKRLELPDDAMAKSFTVSPLENESLYF